jgi:NADH-quinone oxidoreductase subunit H
MEVTMSFDILWFAFHILIFPGLLFIVVMGVLLMGINNKMVARMQNRVGPPILQPWYDFLKCCGKETIIPRRAQKFVFIGAPILGFAVLITAALFIPFGGSSVLSSTGDIVVILYLLTFCSVMSIVGAAASGSPYAGVGLSREMVAMIAYELPFVLVLLAVGKLAGSDSAQGVTFSLATITEWQTAHLPVICHISMIPAAIAMLFVIPCEIGMHPFDIAEAETELCEGTLTEYSGAPLGVYKLTHCVKVYVMTALFTALFMGGITTGMVVVDVLIKILVCLVVTFLSMTLPHAVCARFKVEQVFKFYWTFVSALALISLVLVWIGL